MIRNEQTGEVDRYFSGARHLVSPPVLAKMGFTTAQATTITANSFNLIPKGNDFFPEGMFLRNGQTGEISQYANGQLHLVSNPVATKLALGGSDVATIGATQYNTLTKGNDYFPEGMYIRNNQTGEIDLYSGGQRHWLSVPVINKLSLTTSQVTTISSSQFNGISQGKDYFPDGIFLQNQDTGEISEYGGGQNHLVSSPIAARIGLTNDQLVSVTSAQYGAIPRGPDYFPEGIILQNDQSGEIGVYSGGQRHWVSPQAMITAMITTQQVTRIGDAQFGAIPRGNDYVPPTPPANTASTSGGNGTTG